MTLTVRFPRFGRPWINLTANSPKRITTWVWRTSARGSLTNRLALNERRSSSRRNSPRLISGLALLTTQRATSRRLSKLTTERFRIVEDRTPTLTTTLDSLTLESGSLIRPLHHTAPRFVRMKLIQPLITVLAQRFWRRVTSTNQSWSFGGQLR